ncbi:DUF721 domain-containing protein [Candidatus Peregrinibacteria bacterium]|nr:DUF721 domain-containing protein [Candidatus Peregrinibacteria bacterium]
MDSLASILPGVLRKRGMHGHAVAALVTLKATEWLRAALPALADQFKIERVSDGVLTIAAVHSVASQECLPLLPALKEFLNRECDGAKISGVRMVRAR